MRREPLALDFARNVMRCIEDEPPSLRPIDGGRREGWSGI